MSKTMDNKPANVTINKKLVGKPCHFYHDTHNTIYSGLIAGIHNKKYYKIEFENPGKGTWITYVLPSNTIPL